MFHGHSSDRWHLALLQGCRCGARAESFSFSSSDLQEEHTAQTYLKRERSSAVYLGLDCHVAGLCTRVGGGSQRMAAEHRTSVCPSGSAGTVGKGAIPATDNNLEWDSLLSISGTCDVYSFAELGTPNFPY